MNDTPIRLYTMMSPVHFENVELYEPDNAYLRLVQKILFENWNIRQKAFWTMCNPTGWKPASHGWKIHISTVLENAEETLRIAAEILLEENVPFKFCSDRRMLKLSLGKNWSRFQVGKFIAAYPQSEEEFLRVIPILHQRTQHLVGPHVLTDRAYLDSKAVYYRYGAHRGEYKVDPYGYKVAGFHLANGHWHDDVRGPRFSLPDGIVDSLEKRPKNIEISSEIKLADRYLVKGVLKFNATGGIYHGIDNASQAKVVIREVRGSMGHLDGLDPDDPAQILRREAGILEKLSDTGYVPKFIEIFQEWHNWFLVEEYLEATTLWGQSMEFYYGSDEQLTDIGYARLVDTLIKVAEGLEVIHERGIILRDLTKSNVMFASDGAVKFIDFEFAYDLANHDKWVAGWTPGYASREQLASKRPTLADDYYAFGALTLDVITYCSSGLDLCRDALLEGKLKQVLQDTNLPGGLYDLVKGLTELDPNQRWTISQAIKHLKSLPLPPSGVTMFPAREELLTVDAPSKGLVGSLRRTIVDLEDYISSSADFNRQDRLWPANPQIFQTNPISMQFGAVGVAWFLLRSNKHLDDRILDWIEDSSSKILCPVGLYTGLGGLALLQLYAGRVQQGRATMEVISSRSDSHDVPGLYCGSAGLGLINLHFWKVTGDEHYLSEALDIGRRLAASAEESDNGVFWHSQDKVFLGLGDGQSGISLFLTYLAAASGEVKLSELAGRALDFDLAYGNRVAGRVTWKCHVRSSLGEPNLPHTRFGAAGVGASCLRYYAATGAEKYLQAALDCVYTIRSRVTNKIWQDSGNAGFGEYWLDLAEILGDDRYRNVAFYQAEAILPHALKQDRGVAFAGTDHYRLCSDYGAGGAGIGVFLDRLVNRKTRLLMLDELILSK